PDFAPPSRSHSRITDRYSPGPGAENAARRTPLQRSATRSRIGTSRFPLSPTTHPANMPPPTDPTQAIDHEVVFVDLVIGTFNFGNNELDTEPGRAVITVTPAESGNDDDTYSVEVDLRNYPRR